MSAPDLTTFAPLPRWVAWRGEMRDGKVTKVPYCAPGRQAESDNPATWQIRVLAEGVAQAVINGLGGGIGLMLGDGPGDWISGIDLDTCRCPVTGEIEPWATEIIVRLDTYTEVSPSETGVKVFFRVDPAEIDAVRRIMGTTHGRQFKRAGPDGGEHPPAIEFYLSHRYFAVTDAGLESSPTALRTVSLDDLRWLIKEAGPAFKRGAEPEEEQPELEEQPEPPEPEPAGSHASILERLHRSAAYHPDLRHALEGAATLRGGSRSEGAFGVGAALRRAGWSFDDMVLALLVCPATAEWAQEQLGDQDRQFRRIWERSEDRPRQDVPPDEPADPPPDRIDGEWWLTRALERPTPLLGEVICTTTRMLLGGPTGVGKTHVAMGMAGAIATGVDFLHWAGPGKPLTILFVDGEMARDLIQDRMHDLKRRLADADLTHFHMLCREDFPAMQGLNTPAGQAFLLKQVEAIQPSVVFLDNRMSLLVGDMKDEVPWSETMPLVLALTRLRVAQVWIDHMGHDTDRIYGSKTKEWQMDVVATLTEPEARAPDGADIHVSLKFTKARRRRPDTRSDFAAVTITLQDDNWTSESDLMSAVPRRGRGLPADADQFHAALLDAIIVAGTGPGQTTRKAWMAECRRVALLEEPPPEADWQYRDRLTVPFRKALAVLKRLRMVGVSGETCSDLTQRY